MKNGRNHDQDEKRERNAPILIADQHHQESHLTGHESLEKRQFARLAARRLRAEGRPEQ